MLVLLGGRACGRWNEQLRQRATGIVPAMRHAGLGRLLAELLQSCPTVLLQADI